MRLGLGTTTRPTATCDVLTTARARLRTAKKAIPGAGTEGRSVTCDTTLTRARPVAADA